MATKLQAIESGKMRKPRTAKAKQIVVTFEATDTRKLLVTKVYKDPQEFAALVIDDPTNIPLFARIDL